MKGDKYCTSSLVLPIMTQLLVDLKTLQFDFDVPLMREIREYLITSLQTRFSSVENNKYYAFACLIDPSSN